MDLNFEEFQNGLALEMYEHIQQDLIKRQKDEDEHLLNIKNEKIKIEDGIKQKELDIKNAEIKIHVDNALAIQKQKMMSDHEIVKQKLIIDNEKQLHEIKNKFEYEKKENNNIKQSINNTKQLLKIRNCSRCDAALGLEEIFVSYKKCFGHEFPSSGW